jgi:hypothetical protein
MSSSGEQTPNEDGEFLVGDLLPPSEASRQNFSEVLNMLESHALSEHERVMQVGYQINDGSELTVVAGQSEGNSYGGSDEHRADLRFSLEADGHSEISRRAFSEDKTVKDEEDRREIAAKVGLVAGALPEDEASWLRDAWREAGADTDELAGHTVAHLLDTRPERLADAALEQSHYRLGRKLPDGTNITMSRFRGNQVFEQNWPMALDEVSLTLPGGKEYKYGGNRESEKLTVTDPAQTVKREVAETGPITSEIMPGVGFSLRGTPEIMREIWADEQAREEAARLGLDQPTEGKLNELTAALQVVGQQLELDRDV